MEHRESPRMVTADGRPLDPRGEPARDGRRFTRFVSLPVERRLVLSRLGLATVLGLVGLAALTLVGSELVGRAVRWLHAQPQYQTTFDAIELEPPPPPWFQGGRPVFLGRVRQAAGRGNGPFSAMDQNLADLAREFRLFRWVKRVERTEHPAPNRLLVRLQYRVPVAWARLPGERDVLLDEDGVILPLDEVEIEPLKHALLLKGLDLPLIPIEGLDPPSRPRPGYAWTAPEESPEAGRADERVRAATRLAAFLQSSLSREPRPIAPALRPDLIHFEAAKKESLFVRNAEQEWIYWDQPPGRERPGEPTASQKWSDLREWAVRREAATTRKKHYLGFTKDGIEVVEIPGSR
jgi:hypothetical protein